MSLTSRPRLATLALAGVLGALGCGASTIGSSADLTYSAATDLRSPAGDAGPTSGVDLGADLTMTPACPSIAAYCADPTNPCVLAWPAANAPAAWCSGTRSFNILPETTACPSGDHLLVLSNALAFGTKYFLYRGDALLAVLGFPDDQSTGICLAGDPTITQADISNCVGNLTVSSCVDGLLQ